MLIATLYALLCILQLADVATTHHAITKRIGKEANPIMRWLIERFGLLPALIVPKVALLILLAVMWDAWAIGILCVVYAWVINNNFNVIKKANNAH